MPEDKLIRESRIDWIAMILYSIVAVMGNFAIVNIKVFGMVPTYYRVIIPILFLYFFFRWLCQQRSFITYDRSYFFALGILLFMMVWGFTLLFIGEYVDKNTGFRELLALGFGILSVMIIYEIAMRQSGFTIVINTLRVVIVMLTILAVIEMSLAIHLYTSKFTDPMYINKYLEALEEANLNASTDGRISYKATGIFYNENDFSAFLGLFVPLFLPHISYRLKTNIIFAVELAFILIVLSQNDAWICIISPVVGTIVFLFITKAKIRVWLLSTGLFLVVKAYGVKIFAGIVYFIYKIMPGAEIPYGISIMFSEGSTEFSETLRGQLAGAENESGSAYTRIHTYLEGTKRTFTDSYGIGFGPGSYENYVEAHPSSGMLLSPHSMWLEILMQYGVIITLLFVIMLIIIFVILCREYYETHRREYAILISMDIILVLICFAPSSFFAVPYMWIPIGLSLAMANIRLNRDKKGCY